LIEEMSLKDLCDKVVHKHRSRMLTQDLEYGSRKA